MKRPSPHELAKAGLKVECQKRIVVTYDGIVVGDFSADMLVENTVLVENKAVPLLHPINEVQLVNYLAATRINIGLLLNFGSSSLQFKRKHRTHKSPADDRADLPASSPPNDGIP